MGNVSRRRELLTSRQRDRRQEFFHEEASSGVLVLVAVTVLSAAPTLTAQTMGTNPRPQFAFLESPIFQALVTAVFAHVGI